MFTVRSVISSPLRSPLRAALRHPTLSKGGGVSVNDPRYADYAAFIDTRYGLIAVPDGSGGKRNGTLAEWWATAANASFDSSLYGYRDLVLSAQTNVGTAIQTLMAATDCTVVFESYARASTDRMWRPNAGGDLFLLQGTGDQARMVASAVALQATRRRGPWTSRFRGIFGWSAAGRGIAFNGGDTQEDTTQPGTRSSPNLLTGRYTFIGIIASRKTAAWMKGNSFPEPTAVIDGDSMALALSGKGSWSDATSALIPGSPPMENMGAAGTDGATILARFTSEASDLVAHRIVFGGHNSYDAASWKTQVAAMVAATNGGLANFALFPVFPGAADDVPVIADKMALHAYMKATYGTRYLGEMLDNVVALGAPGQAYEDPTSYALGVPPSGLRYDNLHLNQTGNESVIAPLMRAAYPRLGWRV